MTETLDPSPYPTGPKVALDAKKGSLVVLHGLLPHWSGPNRSDRSRHAYTLHVIDGARGVSRRQLATARRGTCRYAGF